jgi:hypothetical protein
VGFKSTWHHVSPSPSSFIASTLSGRFDNFGTYNSELSLQFLLIGLSVSSNFDLPDPNRLSKLQTSQVLKVLKPKREFLDKMYKEVIESWLESKIWDDENLEDGYSIFVEILCSDFDKIPKKLKVKVIKRILEVFRKVIKSPDKNSPLSQSLSVSKILDWSDGALWFSNLISPDVTKLKDPSLMLTDEEIIGILNYINNIGSDEYSKHPSKEGTTNYKKGKIFPWSFLDPTVFENLESDGIRSLFAHTMGGWYAMKRAMRLAGTFSHFYLSTSI